MKKNKVEKTEKIDGDWLEDDERFVNEGERHAWDLYVSGAIAIDGVVVEVAAEIADRLIFERRRRSRDL